MELRRVTMNVRPAVDHPLYYEWGAGFLDMWIFSSSDEDVIERAEAILSHLPYERVGSDCSIRDCVEPSATAEWRACEASARKIGFSMFLSSIEPGLEGDDFDEIAAP
jgi:hypothetical protein